jgi:lipid-A-disaccharide synthase
MGGKKMAEAGIDIHYDSSNIGVIGVIEVIRRYAEIKRALNAMQGHKIILLCHFAWQIRLI